VIGSAGRRRSGIGEVGLDEAEWDDVLRFTASTYDAASDRLTIGTGVEGPRALTFARILELNDVPLNEVVRRVSRACREALDAEVEIEFALTLDRRRGLPARFGFLQVRPMMVTRDPVDPGVPVLPVDPGDDRSPYNELERPVVAPVEPSILERFAPGKLEERFPSRLRQSPPNSSSSSSSSSSPSP